MNWNLNSNSNKFAELSTLHSGNGPMVQKNVLNIKCIKCNITKIISMI